MATTKRKVSVTKSLTQSPAIRRTIAVLSSILFVLIVASICVISYTIYYFKNNPPTTTATGYVDSLAYAPEQTYAIEINYFENTKANGVQALEYRWNYYTDTLIPTTEEGIETAKDNATTDNKFDEQKLFDNLFKTVYSSGLQMIGDVKFDLIRYKEPAFVFGDFAYCTKPANPYYYNTSNGTSYSAINNLDYTDSWIIDFGSSKLGRIVQDKELELVNEHPFGKTEYRMDINKFMLDAYECVQSLKYGKQVIMFDLSDYLVFEYFSTEDLKFHRPTVDEQHLYINILVNKSANGMINSSQSLFGIVSDDANWTYDGVVASDYWTTKTEITITEANFIENESLLSLNPKCIEYLNSFDSNVLFVIVNIDLFRTTARGFSKQAFGDLQIDKIYIYSNAPTTFTYYDSPCEITTDNNVTLEVVV